MSDVNAGACMAPQPGPYKMGSPTIPPIDDGLIGDALQAEDVAAGLAIPGFGPDGCTPLGCR